MQSPNGRARILERNGTYVDVDPAWISQVLRLDDGSDLAVWEVTHDDPAPESGSLDFDELDRNFVLGDDEQSVDSFFVRATPGPHCPPTVPVRVCEETRHGPCI